MTKDEVRKALLKQRAQAHGSEDGHALHRGRDWVASKLSQGQILGAYRPIRSECDPNPLYHGLDIAMAFPRVMAPDTPLTFFQTSGEQDFEPGSFGVLEPKTDLPKVIPDMILVPLVGFDSAGFRLGYGGGFYDRTLAKYRALKSVLAVGVAYEGQLSAQPLNFEVTDLALDALVTPKQLYEFSGGAAKVSPWS